jgi:serine/threonine protein kinase
VKDAFACDEDLVRKLPLPLAQLLRRACNAKSALERHVTAYYLWEAALKLLGSVAVVEYAEHRRPNHALDERLTGLARPTVRRWWEMVQSLVPVLAEQGDSGFGRVRAVLFAGEHEELPAGTTLNRSLRETLDERRQPQLNGFRVRELFERVVRYRELELGPGAGGGRSNEFHERMAATLLAGFTEIVGCLDPLAGRRLLYVAELKQLASGYWQVERSVLTGETPRRLEPLELPGGEDARLPCAERLYTEAVTWQGTAPSPRSLHPLLIFDAEGGEVLFLNARRGVRQSNFLAYVSGRAVERPDWHAAQRELLTGVLGVPVSDRDSDSWATLSGELEILHAVSASDPATAGPPAGGELQLLSKLGRGGMGLVFRAWQASMDRQVAVKRVLQTGDPGAKVRFGREVRALSRVDHPHLVKVFTAGEDGDTLYYAMELVEGATLAAVWQKFRARSDSRRDARLSGWLDALKIACEQVRKAEQPLPGVPQTATPPRWSTPMRPVGPAPVYPLSKQSYARHIAELVRQVAEAAHALHEAGVIHRDIKPGNIMVSNDGTRATLMDLGLAQLADEVEGQLTRTRQFVGTLRYASPEQVLAVGGIDRRSDIYNLGATLWEQLTLEPIYGSTEQTPPVEIMRRIQYAEPGPVTCHLHMPPSLQAIAAKCLAKDSRQRYPTAHDLAEDLRRFLASEPVAARPVGLFARSWLWCHQPQRVYDAGAFSLFAVVALALWLLGGTIHHVWAFLDARPGEQQDIGGRLDILYLQAVSLALFLPFTWTGVGALRGKVEALWWGLAVAFFDALVLGCCIAGRVQVLAWAGGERDATVARWLAPLFGLMIGLASVLMVTYLAGVVAYYYNRRALT